MSNYKNTPESHPKRRYCFLDFEYNTTAEAKLNLVCCSYYLDYYKKDAREVSNKPLMEQTKVVWLYNNDAGKRRLKSNIERWRDEGYIFIAFNVVAEASSFYALGVDPTKCNWIDLQNEWKMLCNHNNKFAYGEQLINGKVVRTHPPKNKFEQTEEDRLNHAKAEKNLAAMTFKLLGKKIDTDHKDFVRNIIISNDEKEIEGHKYVIQEYCKSDTTVLPKLWERLTEIYRSQPMRHTFTQALHRGRVSADVALMTCWGYPVDVDKVQNLIKAVPRIMLEIQQHINSQFPKLGLFSQNKDGTMTMRQKPLRDWIEKESGIPVSKWMKTEKGQLSLSLDAFAKHFPFRHEYPEGNLGAQIVRILKTKQSLNGFSPRRDKGKKHFLDSLGSDGRVRAYLNPFGSQSARYQPQATSYIPLKAAWMRSLIQCSPKRALCGIDYVSQEFLIAACWAEDENMYKAYCSGDVYLYFAKLAGAVPWDGTKEQYKVERNLFKATTLGISYLMGPQGLAAKLTLDTGKPHSEKDAQDLIDKFNKAFPDYAKKVEYVQHEYIQKGYLRLPCGWVLYGDNPNRRSVSNFPIQGLGSVILRRAITQAIDGGLKPILPLHDAIYQELKFSDWASVDKMAKVMTDAFVSAFEFKGRDMAKAIRLDFNVWSPSFTPEQTLVVTPDGHKMKAQQIYIDERSQADYNRFKEYLETNSNN